MDDEGVKLEVTEVLYDGDDIARASFDSNTNQYLLFFHKKDNEGNNISYGPFDYKVMDHNFNEIRSGEFGSASNDSNDLWYTIQILPLADTLLSVHSVLRDNKFMLVEYKAIKIYDFEYNLLQSIKLPGIFGKYTETDELIAFTFDFSSDIPPTDKTIICLTYNKSTKEIRNYSYQFDSGLEEKENSNHDFSITHNLEGELILASPKGVYKLTDGKWESFLNEYLHRRLTPVDLRLVDSRNRLFTMVEKQVEVYDLNTKSLVTRFNGPHRILGEHPDGDIIIFNHPFFSNPTSHNLYKLKVH